VLEEFPEVAICIVTYDRLPEIKQVIRALKEHFKYKGKVLWHIADDASPHGYIGTIRNEFPDIRFTYTNGNRGGWGVNVNTAMEFLENKPYVFLIEDDYVAKRDLNITAGVALMEANKKVCAVRYDGIAAHTLNLRLREQKTPIGAIAFAYIDKDSPHLNVYSNRPHLRHVQRFKCFGKYPTRKMLGETETAFAHKVKDRKKCADFAILANGIETAFDHIGKSRQGSKEDKEVVGSG